MFGLLAGAAVFGLTYRVIFPPIAKIANLGSVTLPGVWNLNPLLLAAVFTVITLLLFYFLERGLKRKDRLEE